MLTIDMEQRETRQLLLQLIEICGLSNWRIK